VRTLNGPAPRKPTILVTGFGPFLGNLVNPSDQLAKAIAAIGHPTHDFVALTLPVELETAAEEARVVAHQRDVDAILCLGLLTTTPRVRIESVAHNRVAPLEPGPAGALRPIVDTAPDQLRTPLDLGAIARSLDAAGIAWEPSDDAGTYVCNDLYFRLLEAHARGVAAPAGFVHVPAHASEIQGLAHAIAEGTVHALLSLPPARLPRE
jgi:pyroglutamyl-peptidase